jgi:hypothetical protein
VNRVIRKSQARSSEDAAKLLAALFATELIAPSTCLWLVSPWISNVRIIDNEAASFDALTPWGTRPIRLSEVLATLAAAGSTVVIATTADPHNTDFLQQIRGHVNEVGAAGQLHITVDQSGLLHTKAITGDDFAVVGSMNITWNGIMLREEYLELRTERGFVAQARMDCYDRFGGRL